MTGTPYDDIPKPIVQFLEQQIMQPQEPQIRNIAQSLARPQLQGQLGPQGGPSNFRFGGSINRDFNNRFFAGNDEAFAQMNAPQVTAGQILAASGIKPNEQFPREKAAAANLLDPNLDIERRYKESQIRENDSQAVIAKQNADSKGWTTGIITDPDNPKQQITIRHNTITGKTERVKLDEQNMGPVSRPGANKGGLVQPKNLDAIRASASTTLNALDELLNPDDSLNEQARQAVGKSKVGNYIPTTDGYAGRKTIERLQSLLVKDLIAEMKNQSRTGATGYGALNMAELELLKAGASKLDTGLSEEDFKIEVLKIREKLNKILQDDSGEQQMKPVPSHSSSDGRIRVKNKTTGQIGTVSEGAFNPALYERVQ